MADDTEPQPRVDSAYLAKNFLSNLQGPKEEFLMDSREISPQQIATLSQGAEASARGVPIRRPTETTTDSEDESSWLVSPTSTPHTRGSTPYATPGKDTSPSAWDATGSPAAKRARQMPAVRDADGQSDSSRVSSSYRDARTGYDGQGLSRIPRPRPADVSSPTASTASRRSLPEDLTQPSSIPQGSSRIPQPRKQGESRLSTPQRPATSSSSSSTQAPSSSAAETLQQPGQPADARLPNSSARRPLDTASEADGQLNSRGSGRAHVPDVKRSPVAAYIYGPPASAMSDTASEADTQPDTSSKRPPWRYGKAPSYATPPDVVPLTKPGPSPVPRTPSKSSDKELEAPEAFTPALEEQPAGSPLEAPVATPPATPLHELPQTSIEDQNSHHLLLSGRQAEPATAAPHSPALPAADSLPEPRGTQEAKPPTSSSLSAAELVDRYAPSSLANSQPASTEEATKPLAKLDQGLLVIPPDITTPRPQEPPKELELPEQASASLVQPAASASPEEPSAEEQQTLGRPSDPNRLPLTSAVERSKASQRGMGRRSSSHGSSGQQADKARSKGCCGCVVM